MNNKICFAQLALGNIETLRRTHRNAIPIFGGAYHAALEADSSNPNFYRIFDLLMGCVKSAQFYHWHEAATTTATRFCDIAGIDPMLIEAWAGKKFADMFREN